MRSQLSGFMATTALSAPLFFLPVMAGAQTKIGTVAAVNPSMAGTPPASAKRTYSLGLGVIENERVETRGDGSGQLLFVDQSTLTVAPNSDIVLDKFVYDPNQQTGEMALTMTKGVLRLIGGRITKKNPALIKTPTATIGVRGGMALLIVGSNGVSRICNIAGEFVEVEPNSGGGKITLSRPNACAVVDSSGARFDGLIRSPKLAEYYEQLEGDGAGGRDDAIAAANTTTVARRNSAVKGAEDREPISTSGHSSPKDSSARDENQFTQDARVPEFVLTDDELEDLIDIVDDKSIDNGIIIDDDIVTNDDIIDDIGNDFFDEPIVTGLTGGALQTDADAGLEVTTFDEVLEGSLIGTSLNGDVTIPVPGTGENASFFDTAGILNAIDNPLLDDVLAASGGELFSFVGGFPDTGTNQIVGGGFSDLLGPIEGIGLTDTIEDFTYVEFATDGTETGEIEGIAFFGNATEDRGLFYDGDLIGVGIADADFDPVTNTATINPVFLDPALDIASGVSNTAEAFLIAPNFLDGGDINAPPQPLFMIGNQGMARFASNVIIDTGDSGINGDDLVGGGKWLFSSFQVDTFVDELGNPLQESAFQVIADDIKSLQGQGTPSGPVLSSTAFGTSQLAVSVDFGGGSIVASQAVEAISTNLGNLEDGEANTQFGEENRYMIVSSVGRPDNGGALGGPEVLPSASIELFPDFNDGSGGPNLVATDLDVDPFVSLTVRDGDLSERIFDPLLLARGGVNNGDDFPVSGLFERGFMTGVARCETGQCGSTGFGFDGFVDPNGTYQIVTGDPDFNTFIFDDLTNSVQAFFDLEMIEPGDLAFAEGASAVRFGFGAGGTTSGFVDDERFGLVEIDGTTTIGASGGDRINASIATQGLAGTEGLNFPNGTQTDHAFLRWGYWSANYEVAQNDDGAAQLREDIVHVGTFVTGLRPNEVLDTIPTDVAISYSGFAVGTSSSLFSPDTALVAGSFDMTFDFGLNSGTVNINIPDAAPQLPFFGVVNINETVQVTGQQLTQFSGAAASQFGGFTTVDGGFFANPDRTAANNGVAAAGGDFTHLNPEFGFEVVGNFGGSATQTTPSLNDGSLTSQVGPLTPRPGGRPTGPNVTVQAPLPTRSFNER